MHLLCKCDNLAVEMHLLYLLIDNMGATETLWNSWGLLYVPLMIFSEYFRAFCAVKSCFFLYYLVSHVQSITDVVCK